MRWLIVLLLMAVWTSSSDGPLPKPGDGGTQKTRSEVTAGQGDQSRCNLTPTRYDSNGAPEWVSGPVTMRQGLGWVVSRPFKVVWVVPDEWEDGINVSFAHVGGTTPETTEELRVVKRYGTGISFGTTSLGLTVPGCWRISVVHGAEQYDFFVSVTIADHCPTTPTETVAVPGGETTIWSSGKLWMHGDLEHRFGYVLWMVPNDWRDGIHVDVRPYGAESSLYSWHLKQVVRHGWNQYGVFGYNSAEAQQAGYRGLPDAGCWQFIVRHGDEVGGIFVVDVK